MAQSGRDLTPEIVKAALGSAAAQIPAPKINPVSTTSAQMNHMAASTTQSNVTLRPSSQMGALRPAGPGTFQNLGITGQHTPPIMGINQQYFPSPNNHLIRPSQGAAPSVSLPVQGGGQGPAAGGSLAGPRFPSSNASNLSTEWHGVRTNASGAGPTSQLPNRGVTPRNQDASGLVQSGMASGVTLNPQAPGFSSSVQPKLMNQRLPSSQPAVNDSGSLISSGNGFSSDSVFGRDIFSAASQGKQEATTTSFSASSFSNSSNISSASQNFTKVGPADPLQYSNQLPSQSPVKQNQLNSVQSTLTTANVSAGPVTPASSDSEKPWPKMTQSAIQYYIKVFMAVDKDRDGKITGPEARTLFLSWKLPRGRYLVRSGYILNFATILMYRDKSVIYVIDVMTLYIITVKAFFT